MTSAPGPTLVDGVVGPVIRRQERFGRIGSTNDVVRAWLAAGEPEICLALADEQTAGRGRQGRSWTAPAGRGLLLSLGFRPTWLAPDRVWRLAASVSLAMTDAAEEVARLPVGSIRLKWPNDLVITVDRDGLAVDPFGRVALDPVSGAADIATADIATAAVRKLGGVLGETDGLGTADPRVIVGIGLNADWPAAEFPPDLAGVMTSLRAANGDGVIDLAGLLDAFTPRLLARIGGLRDGRFADAEWVDRQVTTGREVDLVRPDGEVERVVAHGVDADSGALLVADADSPGGTRPVFVGEIRHIRLAAV